MQRLAVPAIAPAEREEAWGYQGRPQPQTSHAEVDRTKHDTFTLRLTLKLHSETANTELGIYI